MAQPYFDRLTAKLRESNPSKRGVVVECRHFFGGAAQAAEPIIGRRFADLGQIRLAEFWAAAQLTDEDGAPLDLEAHPLWVALRRGQPSYSSFQLQGLDGVSRRITGSGFPLADKDGRNVGAVGIFWETKES